MHASAVRALSAASARSAAWTSGSAIANGSGTWAPAIEPAESLENDRGCGCAVELAARAALDHPHCKARAHELGVDTPAVDGAPDLVELVVDGRVVGMEHRRHVEPENPRPQALEAADRPEAAAFGCRHPDGGAPVGRDAEL